MKKTIAWTLALALTFGMFLPSANAAPAASGAQVVEGYRPGQAPGQNRPGWQNPGRPTRPNPVPPNRPHPTPSHRPQPPRPGNGHGYRPGNSHSGGNWAALGVGALIGAILGSTISYSGR